jgi:hypothetical protein
MPAWRRAPILVCLQALPQQHRRRLQRIRNLKKTWPAVHGQSRQPDWQIFFLYGLQLGQFVSTSGNCF